MNSELLELPPSLESRMAYWEKSRIEELFTNISFQELRQNYIQTIDKTNYFFFENGRDKVNIRLADGWGQRGLERITIPLMYKLYGKEFYVEINPKEIELNLNKVSKEQYKQLLKERKMLFVNLLETVGSIINRSFRYEAEDFPMVTTSKEFIGDIRKEGYTPIGDETMSGDCISAGIYIRRLLNSVNLPNHIKYIPAVSKNKYKHNTTLVFDMKTGTWGIINSKSFFKEKQFNFVPLDKLVQLGQPYEKSVNYVNT